MSAKNYLLSISVGLSVTATTCMSPNQVGNLPQKPETHPIKIVVHRGANHLAPENTYAAAQKCIDMGLDYVEIDVRQSKDGVFYILHDSTVDRTTDGSGAIASLLSADVDRLDAGSWFSRAYRNERVPRLDEYLAWIAGQANVYLDVKDADLPRLVGLIQQQQLQDQVFFWFKDTLMARELKILDQRLRLKVNARDTLHAREVVEKYNADIIEVGVSPSTETILTWCRQHGIKSMVYAKDTLDYPEVIRMTPDMVNLDDPVAYLRQLTR